MSVHLKISGTFIVCNIKKSARTYQNYNILVSISMNQFNQ